MHFHNEVHSLGDLLAVLHCPCNYQLAEMMSLLKFQMILKQITKQAI